MSKQDDAIQALIASMPTGGTAASTIGAIGVPDYVMGPDGTPVPFTANRQVSHGASRWPGHTGFGRTGVEQVPIQYFEGDDWAPANAGGAAIARLQQEMIEAGLIPKGTKFRKGVWDDPTRQAFREVLTYANATGMNADMAMKTLITSGVPDDAETRPRLVPDIASAAQTVKSTLRSKLGRDATPDEVARLSAVLQGLSQQENDAGVEAQLAESGNVQQVDAGARFEQYLEEQYRPEIERHTAVADLSQSRENLMANVFSMDRAIGV